jgi:hypothetical protein
MFIILSLFLNIIVLFWVCYVLIIYKNSQFVINAWGKSSTSRDILLCIYITFLILSFILLILYIQNPISLYVINMIMTLLFIQVIYKLLTIFIIDKKNPIVLSNLIISIFHIITICIKF